MEAQILVAYGDVPEPSSYQPPALPSARGPVTEWLLDVLRQPPKSLGQPPVATDDPIAGEDGALALYLMYELHYRGLAGVADEWEWEPSLLAARQMLESAFLDALRQQVPMPPVQIDIADALRARADSGSDDGPSLSSYCEFEASEAQLLEVCVHRTAWQLKEADPHTWALPRLGGRPKAALAKIQGGEYGDGEERDVHQSLFALTLSLLDLDPQYGAYLDYLPGVTLASVNLVSMFGLHRRWVAALVGHLAAFEMSSVAPMAAYSAGLRRLGFPQDACHFFDTHVVADAHHQQLAANELAAGLVEQQPRAGAEILWGANCMGWIEGQFSDHVLGAWQDHRSSLRRPLATTFPRSAAFS
jgi:hypothetical protein